MTTEIIDSFQGAHCFLSNFEPAPVTYDGEVYKTVEHAFQAAKTLDPDARRTIRNDPNPGHAKRMGKRVEMRADWHDIKFDVMEDLVRQKFTKHPVLKRLLLSTGGAQIFEGNSWGDRIWGVTYNEAGEWEGENRLGMILMQIRSELE